MFIVVTGPAYSGRLSMASTLLSHLPKAEAFPLITDSKDIWKTDDDPLFHYVPSEEFEDHITQNRLALHFKYENANYGILTEELKKASDNIYVMTCGADAALMLSKILNDYGLYSVCVYMHCSVRTMLFRRFGEPRASASNDLNFIHDIYGDHSLKYGKLLFDSEAGQGFGKIIPVNSDRMSARSYWNEVVNPLTARLVSEAS